MQVADSIAVKNHLAGLPASELPSVKKVMLERGQMGIPILFIIAVIARAASSGTKPEQRPTMTQLTRKQ